jgi:hypothetical protein
MIESFSAVYNLNQFASGQLNHHMFSYVVRTFKMLLKPLRQFTNKMVRAMCVQFWLLKKVALVRA